MASQDVETGSIQKDSSASSHISRIWRAFVRFAPSLKGSSKDPAAPDIGEQKSKATDAKDNTKGGERKPDQYTDAENANASTKVWSIYVSEAERYDKALVESWKGDMSGMLIFSGLYCASLTAFLIESYKTLQADPAQTSATLLSQLVAIQLATLSGVTPVVPSSPDAFEATTASLVCNILWFLSLALSLTCALLATLVEQWARDFLHKTDMRPSPVRRARAFSFLYFGLRKFKIHAVVDAIPMILHASLFFFFAGLIGFLLPVNHVLMYLMAGVLAAFTVIYVVITVLPVIFLDCPYHTPLSGVLWNFWYVFRALLTPKSEAGADSRLGMTDAVMSKSCEDTDQRDEKAVEWTLESLTDDSELVPYAEAIYEALHGPKGLHWANARMFFPLLQTAVSQHHVGTRITDLICNTQSLSMNDTRRSHRLCACYKALWALAITSRHLPQAVAQGRVVLWFGTGTIETLSSAMYSELTGPDTAYYLISAYTSVKYGRLLSILRLLRSLEVYLDGCEYTMTTVRGIRTMFRDARCTSFEDDGVRGLNTLISLNRADIINETNARQVLTDLRREIARSDKTCSMGRVNIMVDYLQQCLWNTVFPHEFSLTCDELMRDIPCPPPPLGDVVGGEDRMKFLRLFEEIHGELGTGRITNRPARWLRDFARIHSSWHLDRAPCMRAFYRYLSTKLGDVVTVSDILCGQHMDCLVSYMIQDLESVLRGERIEWATDEKDLRELYVSVCLLFTPPFWRSWNSNRSELGVKLRVIAAQLFPLLQAEERRGFHEIELPHYTLQQLLKTLVTWHLLVGVESVDLRPGIQTLADPAFLQTNTSSSMDEEYIDYFSSIRDHPLLIAHFVGNALPVELPFADIHLTTHVQIMQIHLDTVVQLLSLHKPLRAVELAEWGISDLLQAYREIYQLRTYSMDQEFTHLYNFRGPVPAVSQRAFADTIHDLVQLYTGQTWDSDLETLIQNVFTLSGRWEWITDDSSASLIRETVRSYSPARKLVRLDYDRTGTGEDIVGMAIECILHRCSMVIHYQATARHDLTTLQERGSGEQSEFISMEEH